MSQGQSARIQRRGVIRWRICVSWDAFTESAVSKKYTPGSQFWHENRGVPRGMRGSGSVSGLSECATRGFSSRRSGRPAASSQAEAPSVGYLGFRARISCSRCTFCEKRQGTYRISGGYRSILIYWTASQLTCLTARQRVHLNRQEETRRKSSTSQRRAR